MGPTLRVDPDYEVEHVAPRVPLQGAKHKNERTARTPRWNYRELVSTVRFAWMIDSGLVGVPRAQKMLKGHLTRVIYHQVY